MSYVLKYDKNSMRLTVLVKKDGSVHELRNGEKTYRLGSTFQRKWSSFDEWVKSENLDKAHISTVKKSITSDGKKVIDILASFMRHPNMRRSDYTINGFKYNVDSYIFINENNKLIPFYISSCGVMLYKYIMGKNFADIEVVNPEFWVKDRGNQIVKFVSRH
jgi:hypothetical protein